jgi:hypothetical protein
MTTDSLLTEPEYTDDQLLAALRRVLRSGAAQIEKPLPTPTKLDAQRPPAKGEYFTIVFDPELARSPVVFGNVLQSIDGSSPPIEVDIFAGLSYLPVSHFAGAFNPNSTLDRIAARGGIQIIPPGRRAPKLSRPLLLKQAAFTQNPDRLRRIAEQLPKDSEDRKRISAKAEIMAKRESQLGPAALDVPADSTE